MVIFEDFPEVRTQRLVIRPNRSLSWRQSMWFLAAVAVPLVLVSVALALRGYWLVMPFAGLELAALFAAFYLVSQASRRREVVSIDESSVTVEKGRERGRDGAGGGPCERAVFARNWVRVELISRSSNWYPRRLMIGASGRRVEVGGFLVEDERLELATQLKRLLHD